MNWDWEMTIETNSMPSLLLPLTKKLLGYIADVFILNYFSKMKMENDKFWDGVEKNRKKKNLKKKSQKKILKKKSQKKKKKNKK